jgi:hypothetical protein
MSKTKDTELDDFGRRCESVQKLVIQFLHRYVNLFLECSKAGYAKYSGLKGVVYLSFKSTEEADNFFEKKVDPNYFKQKKETIMKLKKRMKYVPVVKGVNAHVIIKRDVDLMMGLDYNMQFATLVRIMEKSKQSGCLARNIFVCSGKFDDEATRKLEKNKTEGDLMTVMNGEFVDTEEGQALIKSEEFRRLISNVAGCDEKEIDPDCEKFLCQFMNGIRNPSSKCSLCNKHGKMRCSVCQMPYCSADCQMKDWVQTHKKLCKKWSKLKMSIYNRCLLVENFVCEEK